MNLSTRLAFAWIVALSIGPAALADQPKGFDASVAPILARRCLDCHSGAEP